MREAREFYKEHGNIDATLRKLPRHLVAERAVVSFLYRNRCCFFHNILHKLFPVVCYWFRFPSLQLQCLKKCPGNYLQALKAIPRTLRMMYVISSFIDEKMHNFFL